MSITKLSSWLAALVAAGAAFLIVRTPDARAFVVTGDALALNQRDLRVFDNFTDPTANANHTPDPNFPGYVGAELAIWKGAVEWSSEIHGDGYGDPSQVGGLGSGNANFDFTWQGDATGVGGVDDNILSELSGSGGGLLAFTETPTSDGWRIRFYSDPMVWYDDPNKASFVFPAYDLEGIATHELGHALGLNHSADGTATMYAFPQSGGLPARSIEADDIAGVQSIYGVKSATKPHIAKYALFGGGMIEVQGANFAAAGNELWFTQLGLSSDGTPVTVGGLISTNGGTRIVAQIPANAGPGDVLVHVPGTAYDTLSNPCPFDASGPPCVQPIAYGSSKTTSAGLPATIDWSGQPSASLNGFTLALSGPPGGERAVLFWGNAKQSTPFAGGELSIAGPLHRAADFTLDFFGTGSAHVPISAAMIGTTRFYQYWFTDGGDPFGVGTSNALEISYCP